MKAKSKKLSGISRIWPSNHFWSSPGFRPEMAGMSSSTCTVPAWGAPLGKSAPSSARKTQTHNMSNGQHPETTTALAHSNSRMLAAVPHLPTQCTYTDVPLHKRTPQAREDRLGGSARRSRLAALHMKACAPTKHRRRARAVKRLSFRGGREALDDLPFGRTGSIPGA